MPLADRKVIIVEGKTDKDKIEKMVNEEIDIVCTHGTLDLERMEYLIERYEMDERDIYILVDEDNAGKKLRKQLAIELPHAAHIYVDKNYREVAATPDSELAVALISSHISVNPLYF